jgi:acetoin utilization deacetylase AcuC-like enzyme
MHVESPASKRRFRNLLEVSGLLDELQLIKPRMAEEHEILRWHTPDYVQRIRTLSAGTGGDAGELTPFGNGGYEIAALSAGGCMVGLDAVMRREVRNAYILNRPPGHHAEASLGRGYCIFGNIPLAILHGKAAHGLRRAAVFDWDVHHGNGTQAAFYHDPSVLSISVHQDRGWPTDSGLMHERGEGAGMGSNINIPLPAGCGHEAYVEVVRRVVVPALERFRPEIIIVASGFDASAIDPLGRMLCYSETYREMTSLLMECANAVCDGRLLICHEGGYSPAYVPFCGLAVVETLSGIRTEVEDPWLSWISAMGGQTLQPHQDAVIRAAEALLADVPTP